VRMKYKIKKKEGENKPQIEAKGNSQKNDEI
jgi:hypothetical protein